MYMNREIATEPLSAVSSLFEYEMSGEQPARKICIIDGGDGRHAAPTVGHAYAVLIGERDYIFYVPSIGQKPDKLEIARFMAEGAKLIHEDWLAPRGRRTQPFNSVIFVSAVDSSPIKARPGTEQHVRNNNELAGIPLEHFQQVLDSLVAAFLRDSQPAALRQAAQPRT